MAPRRLPPAPQAQGNPLRFRWGRRILTGREGDTVASALLAAGETILGRSVKYHRPRGYLCGVGKCNNCFVTVEGRPSVRACMTPLREGLRVEGQNAFPSVRYDVLAATDLLFARGFDPQRSFTQPTFLHPLYYRFVRRMAGLGKVSRDSSPARPAPVAQERAQLAVVGAGPAGLAAAWEAARAGARVRVFDEQVAPGGRLGHETSRLKGAADFDGRTPMEVRNLLLARLAQDGCRPVSRATVAGLYPGRLLAVQTPDRLTEIRAEAIVLATGAPESLPLLGNNDRPGVMSTSGAAVLLHRQGILPGERIVLLGCDARNLDLGRALTEAGGKVAAVVDPQAPEGAGFRGIREIRGEAVRVLGARRVRGLDVRVGSETVHLDCDAVIFSGPRRPAVELAQQAGCALVERDGALVPVLDKGATTAPGIFAAGDLLGPSSIEAALARGRFAGLRAAHALGLKVDEARLAEADAEAHRAGAAA